MRFKIKSRVYVAQFYMGGNMISYDYEDYADLSQESEEASYIIDQCLYYSRFWSTTFSDVDIMDLFFYLE